MFKQKKLSLGARFGLSVASFVLGILLFVCAITTALIANLQIVTSEENISGMIKEMMSAPAHVRPKAPITSGEGGLRIAPRIRTYQMPRREEPGNVAASLTDQLIGMFYEEMTDQFEEEFPVSQEEFTQMINDSTVKDYIADKTAALITDYFNDEVTTTFEPEEVVQLIKENAELIETITGEPIPDDIAQQVAQVFDENEIVQKVEAEGLAGFMEASGMEIPGLSGSGSSGEDTAEGSSGSSFNIRDIINAMRAFASTSNLIIGIAVCLVLMAAIILINCRQLGKGLRRAGYPLMWAGCLVILNILAKFQPDLWVITAGDDAAMIATTNLILKLARYVLLQTAVVNIVVFGTGLALCIGGIVLSIVLRPKKSPVSVPTTDETKELAAAIVDETPVEVPGEVVEEIAEEAPVAEEAVEEEPAAEETEEVPQEETAPIGE